MKIQNTRGEELSKGLYSEAEILHIKLYAPFKLLGTGYKPSEMSSWLTNLWLMEASILLFKSKCVQYTCNPSFLYPLGP